VKSPSKLALTFDLVSVLCFLLLVSCLDCIDPDAMEMEVWRTIRILFPKQYLQ